MRDSSDQGTARSRVRANARIVAPVSADVRAAAILSVVSGAIWPAQAAAIAWAMSEWAADRPPIAPAEAAAAVLVIGGVLRAVLDHRAGGLLYRAADVTVARERSALIGREARATAPQGSAAVAALLVQKVPLLKPWITRYQVAMTRVAVLPLLLFALACSQSWLAGLVLLVTGPLIPVFMALVGMEAEQASRRQMDELASINDMAMERLAAMLDIRALGAAERAATDFAGRAKALRQRTMAVLRIAFLSSTVLELFSALGVALIAVFVGFSMLGEITFGGWHGSLSFGQGVFLLLIAPEFYRPMRDLAAAWHDRAAGLAVVADLDALDAAQRMAFLGKGEAEAPLTGPLSIRTFGAKVDCGGTSVTLPEIALASADSLALEGPSGVGKSTALAALAGLVPLAEGRIEVCGRLLDAATADSWRARIAFIPQRPHFPDMTFAEWLDPRGTGTDPEAALALCDATGIVGRLPQGLASRLGETGGSVSGGEARRLMIARAVMMGGDVILADEPTADLDSETAARIIAALMALNREGRTLIVATHDAALAARMGKRLEVAR